jgi:acyl phosphate:glycerol-3-phosphate acyltransferase
MIWKMVLILLGSYLIGSIVTSDIVTHFKKTDLRSQGSGNVGATNVYRVLGPFYGSIVLIGDVLKGVIAVLLGKWLNPFANFDVAIIAGILAIVGHNWPVFSKFKGGKGIATSLGVLIGLTPYSLLIIIPIWLAIFFSFGYVSLASIIVALAYPIAVFLFYPQGTYKLLLAIIVAILAVYRHKSNLGRLIHGQEHRILYQNRRGAKDR